MIAPPLPVVAAVIIAFAVMLSLPAVIIAPVAAVPRAAVVPVLLVVPGAFVVLVVPTVLVMPVMLVVVVVMQVPGHIVVRPVAVVDEVRRIPVVGVGIGNRESIRLGGGAEAETGKTQGCR
jgi:hypothetical protein